MVVCKSDMHPRNPYKNNPPNFALLAQSYPYFAEHCITRDNGQVMLNFKDADSVRALTLVLLERDFGLKIEIPTDCLVPRVPGRLNYILWIEDILSDNQRTGQIRGMDIGTGASCIYALLGCRKLGWSFVATDKDPNAVRFAKDNVHRNQLSNLITVLHVDDQDFIRGAVEKLAAVRKKDKADGPEEQMDFVMCNPPYYADSADGASFDGDGVLRVSGGRKGRAQPHSVTVAQPAQTVTDGGETAFVGRLIEDSRQLGKKFRFYTSLLGRKCSLEPCIQKLKDAGVSSFTDTVFCQGKTQRWGLAWTFDSTVCFQQPFSEKRVEIKKLVHKMKRKEASIQLSFKVGELPESWQGNVQGWIKDVLEMQLNMKTVTTGDDSLRCSATRDTWSKQRRKRKAENGCPPNKMIKLDADSAVETNGQCSSILVEFSVAIEKTVSKDGGGNEVQLKAKYISGTGGKAAVQQILQYISNRLHSKPRPFSVL